MLCPKCRSEHIEGLTACTDCGTLLVERIPEPEPYKFVEILETFKLSDIALIKSILDDGDIEYIFLGEYFNQIQQLAQPARLAVREDQADEAKEMLKNVDIRYLTVDSTNRGEEEEQ